MSLLWCNNAVLRRVARNWRLETTLNDSNPDFDWTSLRSSRFFSPNLGDLQKKKKDLYSVRLGFSVQI